MPLFQILASAVSHGLPPLSGAVLAATQKSSTSSASTLIFFALLIAAGYFFLIRPQRQRARQKQQLSKDISVGDKVMLTSGIIGYVQGFVGDHTRVEIAPGTVVEVVRQAIAQRIDEPSDSDLEASDYGEHEEQGHDDLVEGSPQDPYAVPPLEASGEDEAGHGTTGHDEQGKEGNGS